MEDFPKLYDVEAAASLLGLTRSTLDAWRADLVGPNYLKLGGSIRYLKDDLLDWLKSQRQLPTEAQKMQAAILEGSAERRAARKARDKELTDLDAADRVPQPVAGVTELTMGFAGQAPGMVRCDPITGRPIVAQTTVRDISGRADVTCAVADATVGRVPTPWAK